MTAPGVQTRPRVIAVMGSTGSGKSAWVKAYALRPLPQRIAIWDYSPVPEYEHVSPYSSLSVCIERMQSERFRVAFQAPTDRKMRERAFGLWCEAVLAAGRCTVVVEELRYVTQPSRSPDAWAALVMTGRKAGLEVIGTSQRPAHVDKDFLGNATEVHVGCLGYDEDVDTMRREMRLSRERTEELGRLRPLEYMHLSRESGVLKKGRLSFGSSGVRRAEVAIGT